MSNWKTLQTYCPQCKVWYDTYHMSNSDPRSKGQGCTNGGGPKLINSDTGQEYCTACGKYIQPENTVFYCTCGRVLKPVYSDSVVAVRSDAGVLATDGQYGYVATRTNVTVAGQRSYHTIRPSK